MEKNAPTKKTITNSAYTTTPSADPYQEKEFQEPYSPNQALSDLWSTTFPCKKKEVEFQDDTSLYFKNDATGSW